MRLEGRGLISFFMLFYVQKSLFHYLFINLCQAKKVQFCYLRKIFFHKIPKKVSRRDYNHLQHLNWVHICWIGQNPEKYFLWILSLGSILSEGSVRESKFNLLLSSSRWKVLPKRTLISLSASLASVKLISFFKLM